MSGDPHQCRVQAAQCMALSKRAGRPEVSQAFRELAEIWGKLAAETDADESLYRVLAEMELGEPFEVQPLPLHLRSRAA
jgi:hypothetical protein